jgi:uncharacterized protein YndB with AHSA1/START domain
MSNEHEITIERTYDASAEEIWNLWTTRAGIESWWAPDGFTVEVRKLELEPGGELLYARTATAPEQIEFMKGAGLPLTTESLPCTTTSGRSAWSWAARTSSTTSPG